MTFKIMVEIEVDGEDFNITNESDAKEHVEEILGETALDYTVRSCDTLT